MKRLKTFENWFKKKEEVKKFFLRPDINNQYWVLSFDLKDPNNDWHHIELIMKLNLEYEKQNLFSAYPAGAKPYPGGDTPVYFYFDGIWKTAFDWTKYYQSNVKLNFVTKQAKANEGDKSEIFEFSPGKWFELQDQGKVRKATDEEIKFYDLHTETNKYNL